MKKKKAIRRVLSFLGIMVFLVTLCSCGMEEASMKKLKDVEFTVVDQSEVPQELLTSIEEKKKEGFKLTYTDKESLYVAVGYGKQKTGGYSISVDECYLTENAIYFETTLIGPEKGEKINEAASYPYIVVKMKDSQEPVVFE